MIKIAINGARGRMGRLLVDSVSRAHDMQLVAAITANIDKQDNLNVCNISLTDTKNIDETLKISKPDVLLDFTTASATVETVIAAAHNAVNIVVGTTGFTSEQQTDIERSIKEYNIAAVVSPNFSIGVNVLWSLIADAAKRLEGYDIEIIEIHHNQKKDAPSGTALKAAKIISETLSGRDFVYGRQGHSTRQKEIGIHTVRGGDIAGDHTVLFAGDGEQLEIKHQAHSRQAFASGALLAAKWVANAPGGMYSMKDVLGL